VRNKGIDILIVADLNRSLTGAKVAPLVGAQAVRSVTWVGPRPGPELPGVRYLALPRGGGALRRTGTLCFSLFRIASRCRPTLIMAYNLVPYGIVAYGVSWLFSVPCALNVIGGPLEIDGGGYRTENRVLSRLRRPSRLLESALLSLLRRARFVTTTGSRTRQYLTRAGVRGRRVFAMPSVIDRGKFRPNRIEYSYDICCISALIPRKRIDLLIDLVYTLREQKEDVRLAILGTGPLRDELLLQIERLGLSEHVSLLGFQADVRQALWSSRIYVMTSYLEGLPLSLIEAMACGVPPVVGEFGDVKDLVVDGVNGRIVELSSSDSYLSAITALLEDETERCRLSEEAQKAVARRYTVESGTLRWNELFHQVMDA
jgi:glycosyltransferase involved in cell wall biosynthesis